jgi:hypothetical protein
MAVTSCSSAPGTAKPTASATQSASEVAASSASASPSAVPAGSTRVGGAAQGISVAAPSSWVPIDPTKDSTETIAGKVGLKGISAATLVQDIETLQKLHGILVIDVKFAVDNPHAFDPNLSLYCSASGVTDAGAAGVSLLKTSAAAEFQKTGATNISQKDVQVGGVPGVETFYQLSSSSMGTIYGSQLEVLPKPNDACFVTVSVGKGESAGNVLSTAAATAQFP